MTSIVQDIRFAARRLRNAPGFTAVAVATLALGIGATVAVFSIVYGVLLKPLPYADPSRLMLVTSAQKGRPSYMSPPDLGDYQSMNRTLSGLAGIGDQTANLTRRGAAPLRLSLGRVSANFFDVLGVRATLGRTFAADADRAGAPKVIVLGYAAWRDQFAGDSAVVGKTITLDGDPWTVIGVAPAWLHYPRSAQGWVPLQLRTWERDPSSRGSHEFRGVGRLKEGVTAAQADQDLRDVAARLTAQYPESNTNFSAGVWPLQNQMVQGPRKALLTLLAAVGFVLLVACVNVANLILARGASREGELAVRTALGAGRWDLVRQQLAESVLLAGAGTAIGALLARWLVDAVVAYGPARLPRLDEVAVNGQVLLFAAGMAVLTAILFGLVPALHAARLNVSGALHASGRGSSGRRGTQRTRDTLVVVETALAVVLLVGAGLFLRSFARLVGVDPGFAPENVAAVSLSLPGLKYPKDHQVGAFADRLLAELRAQPGVTDAALGFGRPLTDEVSNTAFEVRGEPPSTPTTRRVAYFRPISPTYFRLLGVPILAGRAFTDADRADASQVMIVNREFVRRFYHGQSPLGKYVVLGWGRDKSEWGADTLAGGEIVGIVPDVTEDGPRAVRLRPVRPDAHQRRLRDGPLVAPARGGAGRDARGGPRGGRRPAGVRRDVAPGRAGAERRAAAVLRAAALRVRRARAAARGARHLRRHLLRGEHADPRVRDPHRPRRHARAGDPAHDPTGHGARADRDPHRPDRGVLADPLRGRPALQPEGRRRRRVRVRGADPAGHGRARLVRAGAARRRRGSCDRDALGVGAGRAGTD